MRIQGERSRIYKGVGPPLGPARQYDWKFDINGTLWFCLESGNPGEWTMTYDPSSSDGDVTTSTFSAAGNITSTGTDQLVEANAQTAAFTLTLPAVSGVDYEITVKKMNANGNKVTVVGTGGELIDGGANKQLDKQYMTFTFARNAAGTGWDIV